MSHNVSAIAHTKFLTAVITTGTGRDWIMRDMNARDPPCDTNGNTRGRALRRRIARTKFRIVATRTPTLHARGRRALSTPGLLSDAASEHTPIQLCTQSGGQRGKWKREKRASKAALHNTLNKKRGRRLYREIFPWLEEKLEEVTTETAQET